MKKKKTEKLKLINNFIEFFKNENNKKVIGILFVLFAMYFFIAFTSFLFQWKEDFSIVADKKNEWYHILTNSEITRLMRVFFFSTMLVQDGRIYQQEIIFNAFF